MCDWRKADKTIPKIIILTILLLVWLGMWGGPRYEQWYADFNGQTRLKKAEWDRKVAEIAVGKSELMSKSETTSRTATLIWLCHLPD